jgi:hypothetical protein
MRFSLMRAKHSCPSHPIALLTFCSYFLNYTSTLSVVSHLVHRFSHLLHVPRMIRPTMVVTERASIKCYTFVQQSNDVNDNEFEARDLPNINVYIM